MWIYYLGLLGRESAILINPIAGEQDMVAGSWRGGESYSSAILLARKLLAPSVFLMLRVVVFSAASLSITTTTIHTCFRGLLGNACLQ